MEDTGSAAESSASGKRKSVEVAHEANELWHADLRLHKQRLKVAWKQLAGQEHLIGAVETLTDALARLGLVGGSSQGKGKGKGRADADGEKDGSEDGEEEDD